MPRPTLRYRTQMKKSTRKLVSRKLELRIETIRTLEALGLARAIGGAALLLAESGNINCPAAALLATEGPGCVNVKA